MLLEVPVQAAVELPARGEVRPEDLEIIVDRLHAAIDAAIASLD